ncbi:MAG: hypothetical protein BWY91_03189 [bacterium ADurb.BinA028]|nr:MAG: hypothetical protein BWY91_03189 [bacterium ADurb.BinA028]
MHVEGLGVPDVVAAPDPIDELPAGQDSPGVAQQQLEQFELLERHRRRLALDRDHVAVDVHPHRAGLDRGVGRLVGLRQPAQHGAHSGEQLTRGVGLGDVVVGPHLEPDDLVDLGVFGGEHDDRDAGLGSQRTAYLHAGQAREHEVQQHEVGAVGVELGEGVGAGRGDRDREALLLQQVGQRVGEGLLVFHDEDSAHAGRTSLVTSLLCGPVEANAPSRW